MTRLVGINHVALEVGDVDGMSDVTSYGEYQALSERAVAPPIVIATKLAAWRGRGAGDVLRSLDVHDIVVLVDGRPSSATS